MDRFPFIKKADIEFSEDPTKLVPRLKQIHKLGDFPGGSCPGKVKAAEPGPPAGVSVKEWDKILQGKRPKVKKAAGLMSSMLGVGSVPSMSEQYYMRGMEGAGGDEENMPLELLSMAGPQAAQGAQMAQMANRLANRKGRRFEQKQMAREVDKAKVVQGLAAELAKLRMEKKGASFGFPPKIEKGHLVQTEGSTDRARILGVPRGSTQKSWKEKDSRGRTWHWREARTPMAAAQKARSRNEYIDAALYGLEKKGALSLGEQDRITKVTARRYGVGGALVGGNVLGVLAGSLLGRKFGGEVGYAGGLIGLGGGYAVGSRLGKRRALKKMEEYEQEAGRLVAPATLSRMAKKRGITDAQARDALIGGDVKGHSWYPREGSKREKLKFMDGWLGDSYPMKKQGYKLQGQANVRGIPIAIENKKGSVRKGKDSDGHEWRTKMKMPYGYIKGTKGADGEEVDVFVGPDKKAPNAFVVHQHKANGKGYDEDKVILGHKTKADAKKAYLQHYDDPKFLGPISRVSTERLKELVASKKRLVKISQVSYRALLDELMEKRAAVGRFPAGG